MSKLNGKTLFISGASRGIGLAIGKRAAQDGANVVIVAKTDKPHPKLPGTVWTAVEEIEQAGGKGLGIVCDIRNEDEVADAVAKAVEKFGGIDALINNASAISLTGTLETTMKRYDLMNQVNARGTFLCSQKCIPHLEKSDNPHILNNSPPLSLDAQWFKNHTAYTIAKFGMSMCALGMAAELKDKGIAVNTIWPRTAIATAAVNNLLGGVEAMKKCRKPEIMADAAYSIITKPSREFTGNFCIDDNVLKADGVTDFDQYAITPGEELMPDFFIPDGV